MVEKGDHCWRKIFKDGKEKKREGILYTWLEKLFLDNKINKYTSK